MIVNRPSALNVLAKPFNDKGFQHFIEKTKIDKDLANRELYPLGVIMAIETHLYDYNEYLKNPMMSRLMQMRKPEIIDILLQNHPEAIRNLVNQGVLQKN